MFFNKKRILAIVFGFVLVFNWCVFSFAQSSEGDEAILNEIRDLKRTVKEQQDRINQLEERVARQESAAQSVRAAVSQTEIDKRIDERISHSAPAYQLMDGLSLSIGATSVVQGVRHANGDNQLSGKESVTDASISTDITFNKKFADYGEALVNFSAGEGEGVDDQLKLFSMVNYDADNDQNLRLTEAWYEFYFKKMSGALTFGKLYATNYIDTNAYANSETTQFLGYMFSNSAAAEFPSSGAGVHFGAAPCDFLNVNFVAVDADGDWENVFDSLFIAGQFNVQPKFFGKDGNYRVYAWSNGAHHTKWADAEKDKENSYGFGLSFDQEVTGTFGIFARYGWQNPNVYLNDNTFSLSQSWSIGPQFKGTLWGRANDVLGAAFGQVMPSERYKKANDLSAKTENHFECYYNFKVNDHVSFSPDFQVIWRPYGRDAVNGDGTIFVGGLRGQVDF